MDEHLLNRVQELIGDVNASIYEFNKERPSLRDQFAMAAPAEIPAWFNHKRLPRPERPLIVFGFGHMPNRLKSLVGNWMNDPNWDIEKTEPTALTPPITDEEYDRLSSLHGTMRRYWDECRAWDCADSVARMVQWRWFYADSMLAAREGK